MVPIEVIDRIVSWLNTEICPTVQYKRPDDEIHAEGYDYELVHPVAFPMYVPQMTDLPDGMSNCPAVCVRFGGEIGDHFAHPYLNGPGADIPIQLVVRTWDPGYHWADLYKKVDGVWTYDRDVAFNTNSEGWRDAWNFAAVIRNALECKGDIDGMEIEFDDSNKPDIRLSPMASERLIVDDTYPYWYAFIDFTLFDPLNITRANDDLLELL